MSESTAPIINDENTTIAPVEQPIVSNETPSVEDVAQAENNPPPVPKRAEAPKGSAADLAGANAKEDWFLTRVTAPDISTKNLFDVYGVDGFSEFKSKEDYWKDSKVQKQFSNNYGSEARMRFDQAYDNSKKEFANFQLGQYQRSQTGHELIREDASALRMDVTTRFSNMAGTLKIGDDWTAPTKDYRENFSAIKVKEIDADGKESYVIKEYSPELLKELEQDPTFGGLAYSDAFYGLDPNEGVNGLYFNAIHDGRVLDEATGKLADVRDDQVVSRWDLDTGPISMLGMFDVNLDRVFKNNKLEADGVLDYAKILVRSPFNMAVNVMDTAVQLTRASIAGGYGVASMFSDEDLDVRKSDLYNWFTTKGIKLKSNNTSMSREAMQDGFFGSLEAALTTTADVALQIALAGGLGRAGAGAAGMINGGLSGAALQKAQNKAAEMSVRGVLTAMSVKDSYNEAIENGYSTSEASVITGAMAVAMWKATKYASYILGDYEVKVLRENIKTAMQTEQQGLLKKLFASVAKEAPKVKSEKQSKFALEAMQKVVSSIFGKATKVLPSSHMFYVARQEGFEEMTEELFQDGVKQVASAYGALINNANQAGKGRYSTIFDEGYFKDAAERYLTSGVAGAIGGPMGMIGHKVDLSPITSASSMTDILMDGRKEELLSVLAEMKNEGSLGPKDISPEWNEALEAFEPIIQGSGSESLGDMIFKQYEHDINVVDTFINKGMFGEAKSKIEADDRLKDFVDNNSMRKDYVNLMGNLLEFHNAKVISMSVYSDLDAMDESKFFGRIPSILKESNERLALKNQEIADIKESVKASKSEKAPKGEKEKESKETKSPKTEKKKKEEKIIGEPTEDKLTRLEKEVKLSSTVTDKDVITLLSNYRKIRAISTGVAAEYYLMQNELADNTMLGSKYNREEKYSKMGAEPFKDMLMSMRFRSKEDEKIHAQTDLKASELENAISSISTSDEEGAAALEKVLKDSSFAMLSEKALKAIVKMYEKADFEQTSIAFDPNNKDSSFAKGPDGKATEEDMRDLYKEIMQLTNDSNQDMIDTNEDLDEKLTPEVLTSFFKSIVKDVRKVGVPEWEISQDGTPEEVDTRYDLIEMIMSKGSNRLKGAINASGKHVLELKKFSDKASKALEMESFYKNDPFKRKNINALFKKESNGTLLDKSLVDDGLSGVRSLIDSGHEGIYTLTDSSKIDEVLEQIEVRLEMSKVMAQFVSTEKGHAGHYLRMLADFRKNVLDIIDFKYQNNSNQDTEIEEHSYKDYTVTSDFFTDFMYDPILMIEIAKKDPSLHTESDKQMLIDVETMSSLLKPTASKGMGNPVYETMNLQIDETVLGAYLDSLMNSSQSDFVDFRTMAGAVEFLEKSSIIEVPSAVVGVESFDSVPLILEGVTKMLVAKWLFKRSSDFIAEVADKATPLPYITAKNNDNIFTMRTFRSLIEDEDIDGLEYIVSKEDPDIELALAQDPADLSPNEIGALNIKIENVLFRVYNNIDLKTPFTDEEAFEMREAIDAHIANVNATVGNILSDNSYITNAAEASKRLSILVGSVTTDFTLFYSKFKRDIESMTEYDNIVVAAQEHAAKHAGAFVYSPAYRKMADALSEERLSFMPSINHISAVYVTGIAGSGKSSSVIQTGLKLAVEILEDSGYMNTAVLPVATFEAQIEIISKSVGALSKGMEGMSVEALHKLLKLAVVDQDEDAIATLSVIGIIAIDEATYVQAVTVIDDNMVELESIDDLIRQFNEVHNITGHKIGLLLLGDPKQSGANLPYEGIFYETSLKVRRVHPIAYMDFSFRSRNSFLGDSLAAISLANEAAEGDITFVPDFIKMEPGTKYGTAAGKLYGINLVDSANKESSVDFYKVLNDDALIDNIETNILKNIADNEARPEGSPEIKFNVLIAPSDLVSYNKDPSKMRTLSEKEGYAKYFKVVAAKMVGGSEANYLIGEMVSPENAGSGATYIRSVSRALTTMATRAFDYAVIVNRNDSIIIPSDAASKQMSDGEVMIPDSTLDGAAKAKLKENYLEILKDIVSADPAAAGELDESEEDLDEELPGNTGMLALPASPKVLALPASNTLLLMPYVKLPGTKFVIPKDEIAKNYSKVIQFIEGDKSLLSHRGSKESFKKLAPDQKDLVKRYLGIVELLLTETDALVREDLLQEIDAITEDLYKFLGQEVYESLIGLQVFSTDLNDVAIQLMMKNNLAVALDTMEITEEEDSKRTKTYRRSAAIIQAEKISKLNYDKRIPALLKAGIISSKSTYKLGNRYGLFLNVNGVKVAFYRSSAGTGGKKKGSWTPFFGFGMSKNNDWLIKGDVKTQVNVNYNSTNIEEYSDILNMTLNWDTSFDSAKLVSNHAFFKVLTPLNSTREFNKELYGVEDLGVINYTSGTLSYIQEKVDLITAAEAPPIDGFTVQQYLSEVERSITDPTLTSTYQKLFEEAVKTPKSKVYSSLMESLEKDVTTLLTPTITNSSGQTAINLFSESQKAAFGNDLDNKIKVLTQSIVLARASFLALNVAPKAPDVDINVISNQLADFYLWGLANLTPDQIVLLVKQFEPGNQSGDITLPDSVLELYTLGFSPESITAALYSTALLIKKKRAMENVKNKRKAKAAAAASAAAAAKREAEKKAEDAKKSAAEKKAAADKKAAEDALNKKKAPRPQRTHADLMKDIDRLKAALGIDSSIIGATVLYNEINKVQNALWKSLNTGRAMNDIDTDMMSNIIEIQDIWNLLYKGKSTTFGSDGYGKGFVYRPYTTNTRKETLKDYIYASNRGSGTYTAQVSRLNQDIAGSVSPISNMKQEFYSPKETLDIFNYSGTSVIPKPKKIVLRVSRLVRVENGKVKKYVDVLIMAQEGNTNHVVSQLDTLNGGPASNQLIADLEEALLKVQYDTTKVFKVGGKDVMDIVLEGEIDDILYTRAGGIMPAEQMVGKLATAEYNKNDYVIAPASNAAGGGFLGLSVQALREGGAAVSETVYVDLSKDGISVSGSDSGNLHGESFVLMSTNNSVSSSLDSAKIVTALKNGNGLDSTSKLKNFEGAIPTELGIARLVYKAPLNELAIILDANPDVQMGAFTSDFAVALQDYFVQHGSTFKKNDSFVLAASAKFPLTKEFADLLKKAAVGSVIKTNIDGIDREFKVTKAQKTFLASIKVGDMFTHPLQVMKNYSFKFDDKLKAHYELVGRDLARFYESKGEDYKTKIKDIISVWTKSETLKTALDDFATGYLVNNGISEGPSGTKTSTIIYPSSTKSGGYVFNINEYLRGKSVPTLKKLTLLSDVAKYSLKPNVRKGKNDSLGIVDAKFTKAMAPYMMTSIVGIKIPSFIITAAGTAKIRAAINNNVTAEKKIKFTNAQVAILVNLTAINALESVEVTNKLLSLGLTELKKMLDEISFLTTLIKGSTNTEKDKATLDSMKSKIEGVLNRATIQFNGVSNDSLPEFVVKSNDIKHPIRAAFMKVLLEYEGGISSDKAVRDEAKESALGLFAFMEENDFIENPNDPSAAVKDALMKVMSVYGEDEDFIEFLNKCNF